MKDVTNEEIEAKWGSLSWNEISPETYDIVIKQGEGKLRSSIESMGALNRRSLDLVKTMIALSILNGGYLMNGDFSNTYLKAESIVFMIFIFVLLVLGLISYRTYKVSPIGNSPINILTTEKLAWANKYSSDKPERVFLFNYCKTLSKSISDNDREAISMTRLHTRMEWVIVVGMICLAITPLVIWWFS